MSSTFVVLNEAFPKLYNFGLVTYIVVAVIVAVATAIAVWSYMTGRDEAHTGVEEDSSEAISVDDEGNLHV